MESLHQVIKKSFNDDVHTSTVVAGNGINGSSPNMLNNPRGIFVDVIFNLYVVDCENNRIQLFPYGQLNGTTVAGNGSSGTFTLNCPAGVVLDADEYLYISDCNNNRIVQLRPNGFRCLVGCRYGSGSAPNQLSNPRSLIFDSYGNIFVVDGLNDRVQKFLLATNSCSKSDRDYLT
jgi:sugar lactone lactonase YvrE